MDDVALSMVTFQENLGYIGGGMLVYESAPTLTGVTFDTNYAHVGGGLTAFKGSPKLDAVTFKKNVALQSDNEAGFGGGMLDLAGSSVLVEVTFQDNSADAGGGMTCMASSATLRKTVFQDNQAFAGGGMYTYGEGSLTLTNVTFKNNSAKSYGGGMANDHGSTPTLSEVTFKGNTVTSDESLGGGMINLNKSNPVLKKVVFSSNTSQWKGGGMYNDDSSPTLENVTFAQNEAAHPDEGTGGGMCNVNNSAPTLKNVTFTQNSASYGGGIANNESNPALVNVTFDRNSANHYGGGVNNYKSDQTLTNVTFSGNSATYQGGGIYNKLTRLTLINVTLIGNSAEEGGGIYSVADQPSETLFVNVLIGNSKGGDCLNADSASLDASSRNNLFEDGAHACGLTNGVNSNILGQEAKVGLLGDYGGETQTIPVLLESPAINAGDDASCPDTDQRDVPRPQRAHCDIGAYERADFNVPVVTSIARADSNPTSATEVHFTVTFSEAVTGVDTADFSLMTTGSIGGASVTSVADTGDQQHYTVTVNTGSGDGTLRLDVPDTAIVTDLTLNPLKGIPYTAGETYLIDKTAPLEVNVGLKATYTGRGPSSVQVTFSEPVYDPAGNTALHDVTNPANYMLVERGRDQVFNTVSCAAGVGAGDTAISTDRVVYDAATLTATAYFNGGRPLRPGHYRLFVCGTTSITDLGGNHLNGGEDAVSDFVVVAETLPQTGFSPGQVSRIGVAKKRYAGTGMFLEIPRLGLRLPVVEVPSSENGWNVQWLGWEAGWLEGTAFPTWAGNTVLTTHVWDAQNQPGPFVGIRRLQYGNRILIRAWGQVYVYEVRENLKYRAWTPSTVVFPHKEQDWVTLMTCEGYNQQTGEYDFRRVVRAVLVEVHPAGK